MATVSDTKPNGPVAAAVLAGGIGCFVMGLVTTLDEVSGSGSAFDKALDFAKNYGIGSGVGPLSGKAIIAVLAFVLAWVVAHAALRGKEVAFGRFFTTALVLIAVGFLLTFPPIFDVIAGK